MPNSAKTSSAEKKCFARSSGRSLPNSSLRRESQSFWRVQHPVGRAARRRCPPQAGTESDLLRSYLTFLWKSVQSLHIFSDEKPEAYNRTSTSGGKVFSQLPQPVIATTRNIELGPHNPITNRTTRLRSNIEHGRRSPLVISKRRGQCDGTGFTPPVQTCPAGSRRPVPAGRGTVHR